MSQGGPSRNSGSSSGNPIETITGNLGGPVGPDAGFNFNLVANTTMGITTVGTPASHQINILGLQSSTTQIGVVQLATNAETIAGVDTTKAITSDDLAAKLGTQTANGLPIGAGSSSALSWTASPTNGQLLIGSTGVSPVLANLTAGTGISIANGPGTISIAATGTAALTYTSVTHAMSPYTILSTDQYLGVNVSGGVVTVKLPNSPATGTFWIVKDSNGLAATSNITVTTVGGAINIDGSTSFVMNTNYEAANFIFNGATYEVY